jgi:hypothetical protein
MCTAVPDNREAKTMRTSFCIVVIAITSFQGAAPLTRQLSPPVASCLHDANARESDRHRRMQALALAKAINTAEAEAVRRTRQYHPVGSLRNVPAVPPGFALKLFADRDDYVFAIKDTNDPCHYAIFSDSAGFLYEKNARAAPVVAQ